MATVAPCWPARAAQACAQGVPFRRPRPQPATAARHVWAYDFVFDARANGQQLNCLTVIDEYTRECLAIDVAGSICVFHENRAAVPQESERAIHVKASA